MLSAWAKSRICLLVIKDYDFVLHVLNKAAQNTAQFDVPYIVNI